MHPLISRFFLTGRSIQKIQYIPNLDGIWDFEFFLVVFLTPMIVILHRFWAVWIDLILGNRLLIFKVWEFSESRINCLFVRFDLGFHQDLLAAQLVNKGLVRNETIFILLLTKFIKELLTVLFGNFIAHQIQEGFKFSQHAILIFVIQFT